MEPEAKKAKLDPELDEQKSRDDEVLENKSLKKEEDAKDSEVNNVTDDSKEEKPDLKFVKEEDVGILCYISDLPGCHGVIKQRYSDFIVNEVDENGQVVHLTKLEADCEMIEKEDENKGTFDLPEEVVKDLTEFAKAEKNSESSFIHINFEGMEDKDLRTKYHHAIKETFRGLDTSTVVEDDKRFIKVVRKSYTDNKYRKQSRSNDRWPSGREKYCRFVLYKENRDTMSAVSDIARFLKSNRNSFQYAGTKDKRAKTTQEITAYKMFADRLEELNKRMKYMRFGNFRYVDEPLKLGKCKGNRFTIVIRNVTENEILDKAMESLRDKGFINYFGMQRFGTTTIPTHHIGRAILKNDYEEAVNLILRPRPGETGKIAACRECWEKTKNAAEASKGLPYDNSIERSILVALKSDSKNYSNAFQKIPRNTKLLYLHAFQSYVWNTVVSLRIKQYGLKPIVGDLVLPRDVVIDDPIELEESTDDKSPISISKDDIKVLTDSDVSQYSILDVVLPLPGFDMVYPENEVGKLYEKLFDENGLTMDSLKHKVKALALPGSYKRIVVQPADLSWKFYSYNDVNIELALSDLDRLNNKPEPVSVPDGQFKALQIEMTLPTSCYATMALREVLKIETSSAHQSTLNVS